MYFHPSFSVYETIEKQCPANIFLSRVSHMYHFSRVIEQDIIKHHLDYPLYVGMQALHNLKPVLNRYRKITQVTGTTYVFAEADSAIIQPCGLHLVPLTAASKLANEWFLVVNHPHYARILSAREITPMSEGKQERMFEAILTTDKSIVERVSHLLAEQLSAYTQVAS